MIQDFLVYISLAAALVFLVQKFFFSKKSTGCAGCAVKHGEKITSKSKLH